MKKIYFILGMLLVTAISFAQDPCASITTITCNSAITFSQTGTGSIDYPVNFGGCISSSSQGGKEQIYQITATTTGTYELEITSASGGYVQYLIKEASLGCNNTAWTCLNRLNTNGSVSSVNLVAGTSYYILLNAESTTSTTHVFNIKCARVVCDDILPLACGVSTTFTRVGYGDPNYAVNFGGCISSSSLGGKEQIYSFTPTITGNYELEVTNASGGYVQYLIKEASLGCNNTAWNCLNRVDATGSLSAVNLVAGTNYYLMLNAESANTTTQVFDIKCARVVCNDILPITCGISKTYTTVGYGDPNYAVAFGGCISSSSLGGKEQIYQFVPTVSGTYELEVTTASGGYIQYLIKEAVLGCNNTAWNCLNRVNDTGSVSAVNLIAGTTYYIMLNAESASNTTQVFNIKCARVVCDEILPINACSDQQIFTRIGYGDPNYAVSVGGCISSSSLGGKEQIYFIPASPSAYQVNITTASGGYVQYLWKAANLGCDNSGWNCLGRKNNVGLITNSIPANTPAYLLVNSESANTVTHVFTLNCTTLAVNGFENYSEFTVSPNPTTGTISFKNLPTSSSMTYEVYNSLGQTVMSGELKNQSLKIDGQNGLYTLKIKAGANEITRKIILKK